MEKTLASDLGNRGFLMNNVHDDHPVVFQSRWALSFLRGPVSRDDIAKLMAAKKALLPPTVAPASAMLGDTAAGGAHPILPPGIAETFVIRQATLLGKCETDVQYRGILATTRIRFVQTATGIDTLQDMTVFIPAVEKVSPTMFDAATINTDAEPEQQEHPDGAKQALGRFRQN